MTFTPAHDRHAERPLLADAKTPVALPIAGFTGFAIAVLVLGAGVIGIRDGIVAAGWIGGSSWTVAAVDWIDGLTFAQWMIPVAVAAVVVGFLLLIAALKPRRTTAVAVTAETSVWIEPSSIARIAADSARSVPGVVSATSTATRRTVVIRAHVTGNDRNAVSNTITERATQALSALERAPKVTVRTRIEHQS